MTSAKLDLKINLDHFCPQWFSKQLNFLPQFHTAQMEWLKIVPIWFEFHANLNTSAIHRRCAGDTLEQIGGLPNVNCHLQLATTSRLGRRHMRTGLSVFIFSELKGVTPPNARRRDITLQTHRVALLNGNIWLKSKDLYLLKEKQSYVNGIS